MQTERQEEQTDADGLPRTVLVYPHLVKHARCLGGWYVSHTGSWLRSFDGIAAVELATRFERTESRGSNFGFRTLDSNLRTLEFKLQVGLVAKVRSTSSTKRSTVRLKEGALGELAKKLAGGQKVRQLEVLR